MCIRDRYVTVALVFKLVALAPTGLEQPGGVVEATSQGGIEPPAMVGAVVVVLDQARELVLVAQQVIRCLLYTSRCV